ATERRIQQFTRSFIFYQLLTVQLGSKVQQPPRPTFARPGSGKRKKPSRSPTQLPSSMWQQGRGPRERRSVQQHAHGQSP
ncbi:hypothetical protein VIGAN_UM054900, partial [Vigna angularis var. angularis]